jgi:hypothetical protein
MYAKGGRVQIAPRDIGDGTMELMLQQAMTMAHWSSHWNEQWCCRWICAHFSWKHLTLSARPTKIARRGRGRGKGKGVAALKWGWLQLLK